MAWRIVQQTEKRGKAEYQVDVKHVRYFPTKDGGGNVDGFGRLSFLCLRVIVRNDSGDELKLTLHTADGDYANPSFTITHPDTVGKPLIWVGQGRNRQQIPDMLARDVTVPGVKEKFRDREDFERRLAMTVGKEMTESVMAKFAARFVNIVQKREAKLAAA